MANENNKTDTNMTGVCVESFLPFQKLAGYDYLYQTIKDLYGKEEAKKCTADMFDFSLFLNDSLYLLNNSSPVISSDKYLSRLIK